MKPYEIIRAWLFALAGAAYASLWWSTAWFGGKSFLTSTPVQDTEFSQLRVLGLVLASVVAAVCLVLSVIECAGKPKP